MTKERIKRSLVPALACVLIAISGCSSKKVPDPKCYSVTGKVTFKGKPCQYALVSFLPAQDDGRMPAGAECDEMGEFQLLTQKRIEGAEPGDYLISISWQIPANPRSNDPEYGKQLLPAKYLDPKTSGLKFTVEPTDNEVPPFDLNP